MIQRIYARFRIVSNCQIDTLNPVILLYDMYVCIYKNYVIAFYVGFSMVLHIRRSAQKVYFLKIYEFLFRVSQMRYLAFTIVLHFKSSNVAFTVISRTCITYTCDRFLRISRSGYGKNVMKYLKNVTASSIKINMKIVKKSVQVVDILRAYQQSPDIQRLQKTLNPQTTLFLENPNSLKHSINLSDRLTTLASNK